MKIYWYVIHSAKEFGTHSTACPRLKNEFTSADCGYGKPAFKKNFAEPFQLLFNNKPPPWTVSSGNTGVENGEGHIAADQEPIVYLSVK